MDTSIDPCDSLYDFATNHWRRTHPIPAGKTSISYKRRIVQRNVRIIQGFLEPEQPPKLPCEDTFSTTPGDHANLTERGHDQELLAKLRSFYTSCMSQERLEEVGSQPLLQIISGISRAKGLTAALSFLHGKGVHPLFEFAVDGDPGDDPDAVTLWFSQPAFGLPSKEYFKDESTLNLYTATVWRLLASLCVACDHMAGLNARHPGAPSECMPSSATPSLANNGDAWAPLGDGDKNYRHGRCHEHRETYPERFASLAAQVVGFEKKLVNASLNPQILYGDPYATYNPLSFTDFSSIALEVNFEDFLTSMSPHIFPTRVIVTSPDYLRALSNLLRETPPAVVEAYLIVRAGLALAPYLGHGTDTWKATHALQASLSGVDGVPPRGEWCVETIEEAMGFAIGRYYVNKTFTDEAKERATFMAEEVIREFKGSLGHLKWMDAESARAAAEKAIALRLKIGYPTSPDIKNAAKLLAYYRLVNVDERDFFGNVLSARSSDVRKMWDKVGKRRDLDEWFTWPSHLDAFYSFTGNYIILPAAIFQSPNFNEDWPAYVNYAAFGVTAAHELTHAFDSIGRLYDQRSRLNEWWSNETAVAYDKRAKCISRQYSNYSISDGKTGIVYLNGQMESSENIADSGLIYAYNAWDQVDSTDDLLLPGLNYTKQQLFFISFALSWTNNVTVEAEVERALSNPHAPTRFRVDGTVRNIAQFAAAFDCPIGSKLNPKPEERCELWT